MKVNYKYDSRSFSDDLTAETECKNKQSGGVEAPCNENRLDSFCSKTFFNTMAVVLILVNLHCFISKDLCSFFSIKGASTESNFLFRIGRSSTPDWISLNLQQNSSQLTPL